MLEGNFMDQLDEIIKRIGEYEQMLMFTATMTGDVNRIINKYIKEPVRLTIGGDTSFNSNITQEVMFMRSQRDKIEEMLAILRDYKGYKVLVFANTKRMTQTLSE